MPESHEFISCTISIQVCTVYANPTFKQLLQFLTNMMGVLVDGTFVSTSAKRVATREKIETPDGRAKSGKTTRNKQERIVEYELQFQAPLTCESKPYTALERIDHLIPIEK